MMWQIDIHASRGPFELQVHLEGDAQPVAVIGPNGSGKTTLLRMIAGLDPTWQEEILFDGDPWVSSSGGITRAPEHRDMGFMPQGSTLFPHLSVLENVCFGHRLKYPRPSRNESLEAAREALAELGCLDVAERQVHTLSGGEAQRVALARALVIAPRMLLLDEPLAALDAMTRRRVRAVLAARLEAFTKPALVVTHDVQDAMALGARFAVLDSGRVVQTGSLEALRADPVNAFVAAFVEV